MVWMIVPRRSMSGMVAMSARGAADEPMLSVVIGGYCLVSAIAWLAYASRIRRDIRTLASYAAMTAAMGVTLLALR
jgi:hypothetical protein